MLGVSVINNQIFYLVFKFFVYYENTSYWSVVELVFFTLVSRITYTGIKSSLVLGVGYEYYLDVYCINLAVQALCVFSGYFWFIYATIPGYLMFYAFKYFLVWANSTGAPEENQEPEAKKPKKQKIKYIKSR